jgi:hypothetical protein
MSVNNFGPFQAEIWGTVSDWLIVIVTGATGILLLLTFRSQLKVQYAQQKITDIEIFKHIQNVVPKFDLLKPLKSERIVGDNLRIDVIQFVLQLNKNIAKDVSVEVDYIDQSGWVDPILLMKADFLNSEGHIRINGSYKGLANKTIEGNAVYWIDVDFNLIFKDIYNNEYSQKCALTLTHNDTYVRSDNPILIKQILT